MTRTRTGLLLFALAAATALALDGTAAGVKWTVPVPWKSQGERPMRVATYDIPAAAGSQAGECGGFYFGMGRGGGIDENFARWVKQFESASAPKKAERTVQGLKVHTIDVSGTYLAPAGPVMPSQGKKARYRLIGAIIDAPHGLLFSKCTGPASTITKAQPDFDRLLASITKAPTT